MFAKLKYMRMWNYRAKSALSTRLRWSKVFGNRLNTYGDIKYLLGRLTWLKVENFKSSRRAKFSPFHCKSKIPAHPKYSSPNTHCLNLCQMNAKFLEIAEVPFDILNICWLRFTSWEWEISNLVDGPSFQLVTAKLEYLRTRNIRFKCPLSYTFQIEC